MGRKPTGGGVRPNRDRIEVRFVYQGARIAPTLDLRPTAANLKHAARVRETVLREIALGTFKFSEHFPDYKLASKYQPPSEASERSLDAWARTWALLAARTLEHSTLAIYRRHWDAYWSPAFGHLRPEQVTHVMILERLALLAQPHTDPKTGKPRKGLSRKSQNNILIPLRAVFELVCKPPSTMADPTAGIDNLKVQKGKPDPFAPDEVEVILSTIGKQWGEVFQDYFEFSFFAGLRASEQIALTWEDVDLRLGRVVVCRARVMGREKERTKTHVEREVELNARALAVLQRQRARTQAMGKQVFYNPATARPYVDEQKQHQVWTRSLRTCQVRYRPPKECRDTSVTLALMAGANPMWVALQHGHSVQVMLRDYAKWIPSADKGANLAAVNQAIGGTVQAQKNVV
jgi:integrase